MRTFQPVELWPTYAQATEARKRYARAGDARRFGVRVLALDAWIEELWSLFGDGRSVVSPVERDVLLAALASESDLLQDGAGTVRLLGSIARQGSGLAEFERALQSAPSQLTPAERAVMGTMSRYRSLALQAGRVEPGEALAALARELEGCAHGWSVRLRGFDELAEVVRRFFEALAEADVVRSDGVPPRDCRPARTEGEGGAPCDPELRAVRETVFYHSHERTVAPTGAVRFALPMGRYASAPLLADEAKRLVDEARAASCPDPVVLSCARPVRTFEELSARLARRGVRVAVQGVVLFKETAFGRAFLSLARFLHEDDAVRSGRMLTDFMESPFSGVPLSAAQRFDAAWRGDRDVAHDATALMRLAAGQSEWAALMAEAAQDGDAVQVRPSLERLIASRGDWSEGFKAEQRQAVSVLCEVGSTAQRFGVPFRLVLGLLEDRPVSVGALVAPPGREDGRPDVLVVGERRAAQLAPGSAFALVSADMTAADCPVRTDRGAKEALFERLGIPPAPDALARARARFARVLAVPSARLVLSRPLNTVDADEQYPSVMFEEVLDCYRADVTADDDLDRAYGVPAPLVPFVSSAGEDAVGEAVDRDGVPPAGMQATDPAPTGVITEDRRADIVVSRIESGPAAGKAALSATQVESYLECPYKWFALRRLRLDTPDAGFGAMEMGVLVHRVMSVFYERLQDGDPSARVLPENRAEARSLAAEVFWECFERQRAGSSPTRVAPQGELEMAQVRELAALVEDFVEGEADFLPGFTPRCGEWEFGKTEPFVYAGHALRGSIDRIDVDEKGRAVVVDYKGGIGSGQDSPYLLVPKGADEAEGFVLPGKVQALVYAQVARRSLGLDVVGALYANYGKGTASGAVDDTVVDPACARMEGAARRRSCLSATGFATFGELLDEVEARVAAALDRMVSGDIAANPTTSDACVHCPVTVCDKRTA